METLIIAILGVVVIAAVAIPLFRGGRSEHHDAHEYGSGLEATSAPAGSAAAAPLRADPDAGPMLPPSASEDALEVEIARYRAAVAAGTVCRRCGEANAADAKFCADCGKPLAGRGNDAQEFA